MNTPTLDPAAVVLPAATPVSYDRWWRCLFDVSEDALVICNRQGLVCEANSRGAQLLDLRDRPSGLPFSLYQALTANTAARLADFLKRESAGQTTIASVTLLSGGQMSLIADLQATRLDSEFALVTIRDASRRWRMESHVQRLITAVDATPDVVFLTDTEQRLVFVNPAFQLVTGYTIEDALGRTPDFLRATGEQSKLEECLARIAAGLDWRGELTNQRSDGSTYPVAVTVSPIFDKQGQSLGYVSFERDITQHKRLQDELRREHNHALSIIDSLDSAVYTTDSRFQLSHVNDGWKKLPAQHGWLTLDEPPQAGKPLLDYVKDPGRRLELESIFRAVLAGGEPHEIRTSGPDNRHWLMKVAPWRQEGVCIGLIYVVNDQTQFHELQKQLYQAQKMETIGALAAGVAHDFNNLLQAVRGHVGLLLLDDQLGEPTRVSLQQIDQAAGRAADITRQLLSFSRASDDQESVLDLNQAIADASQLARRSLRNRVDICLQPAASPVKVRMDGTRVQQVLLNLCVNAQDAMPAGGRLTMTNTVVLLSATQAARLHRPVGAEFARCSVADTGTGMAPEVLARIFNPFFTTKEKGRGTGLGLAIVQSVVDQSGGFVEVESQVGHGTTFHVYLPLVHSGNTDVIKSAQRKLRHGSGRVLLVDDLDLVLDFTRAFLQAAGYEVFTARCAEEAEQMLAAMDPPVDLVFTDYNMGEKNGVQLIEETAARWPGMKFILATGYLEEEERRRIDQEPRVRVLNKPFNIREAADLMVELLGSGEVI